MYVILHYVIAVCQNKRLKGKTSPLLLSPMIHHVNAWTTTVYSFILTESENEKHITGSKTSTITVHWKPTYMCSALINFFAPEELGSCKHSMRIMNVNINMMWYDDNASSSSMNYNISTHDKTKHVRMWDDQIALHRTRRLYSKLIRQNLFLSKLNKKAYIN